MRIEIKNEGKIVVVKTGASKLDAGVTGEFADIMNDLIENGNWLIVLDIFGVEFMDSSFLGAIISSLKKIGKSGNIAILGASNNVMRLFELTRLDKIFPMYDNEVEAVKELKFVPSKVDG